MAGAAHCRPTSAGDASEASERRRGPVGNQGFPHVLVAQVEVARTAPETVVAVDDDLLEALFARPWTRRDRDRRLGPVQRLLEASLLLALEERVVLERILG